MAIQRGPKVFCEGCRRDVPTYHPASDENARLHYQKHYLDAEARRDWCSLSRELVPQRPWGMRDELALAVQQRGPYTFSAPGAAALLAEFDEQARRVAALEAVARAARVWVANLPNISRVTAPAAVALIDATERLDGA